MVVIDTSALVRYFTNDDKAKAKKVALLLSSREDLTVPDVVFAELEYVLKKLYGVTQKQVSVAFNFLAARKNIEITPVAREAIYLFGENNLSLTDCLVAVTAMNGKLASFDEKLLKAAGVKNYW